MIGWIGWQAAGAKKGKDDGGLGERCLGGRVGALTRAQLAEVLGGLGDDVGAELRRERRLGQGGG